MGAGHMPSGQMAYPHVAEVQAYLMRPERPDLLNSLLPATATNPTSVPVPGHVSGHVSPVTHAMPRNFQASPTISAHLV